MTSLDERNNLLNANVKTGPVLTLAIIADEGGTDGEIAVATSYAPPDARRAGGNMM